MIEYGLLLMLLFRLDLPYEADTWPLDEVVVQQVEEYAVRHYGQERNLRNAVAYEQGSFLRADVVLVGECEGAGPPASSRYGPCVTQLFRTERCLKGACADTVALHSRPSMMRGMFDVPLGVRPVDSSSPERGTRYLLIGRADGEDPDFLWGGLGHDRYELRDGMVICKGVPESLFVSAVERLLSAAADSVGDSEGN